MKTLPTNIYVALSAARSLIRVLMPNAKILEIENKELTIYHDMQCPYISQYIDIIKQYCETNDVPVSLIQVDTLQKAKELPCVFNNFAVFYKGVFETVNLTNTDYLKRILKK